MIDRYLTEDQTKTLDGIAHKIAAAEQLIETAITDLMLMGVIDGKPFDRLSAAEDAIGGLGYMFTPQTEWQGNDRNGDPISKDRKPHIFS